MADEFKVFKMNDCDWVVARSLEEAKEFYLQEFFAGNAKAADEAFDGPCELTPAQMNSHRFVICDEDDSPTEETISYREQLENVLPTLTGPELFASTEY